MEQPQRLEAAQVHFETVEALLRIMCCKGKNSESDKYCVFVGTIHNMGMFYVALKCKEPFVCLCFSTFRNLLILQISAFFLFSNFRKRQIALYSPCWSVGRLVSRSTSPLIFFNIYRHNSPLLTQYHLIPHRTML